jgi:signal transduction histidine kinase
LGLAIAHDITVAHDGVIDVSSPVEDGRGVRFRIHLPSGRVRAR